VVVELQGPESGGLIDGHEPMLGAENLNAVLAEGGLPLPGGIQVERMDYRPGTQTDVIQRGEVQIFQGASDADGLGPRIDDVGLVSGMPPFFCEVWGVR